MNSRLIGLDVGEKRIGVALGDGSVRIASPHTTVDADGTEFDVITQLVADEAAETIVVGYPRNQSGDATAQSRYVEEFAEKLTPLGVKIVFQDESLTSVMAEQRLIDSKKPYEKKDIDAHAAAIILQDYLETH